MANACHLELGSYVVYPAHGVGKLVNIESYDVDGVMLQFYVINFEKERMTLRLPPHKAQQAGLRKLSSQSDLSQVFQILDTKRKPKRALWGRRAQEYEGKINSGDPSALAEVVRELFGRNSETDQSYSERQLYQTALERLAREVSIVQKIGEIEAAQIVEERLRVA
jgi:CarD family transcriptional regulator